MAVIETLSGLTSGVVDPYAGTEFVANQDLMPHQAARIDEAVQGPLAKFLRRAAT
jgi:hypothetical protein